MERPYQRPVPGPREVRGPDHPGGGGERTAPFMVGLCCVVLCGVPLRCGVLCCAVLRCVVCGGGVWPPAWWGVLRWCVAPLMVGRVVVVCGPPHGGAVLRCVVLCPVALRCVVLCCVAFWCVWWW